MSEIYKDGRIFRSIADLVSFRFGVKRFSPPRTEVYRGHADENWKLIPRLFRGESDKRAFVRNRLTTWQFLGDLEESGILQPGLDLSYLQLLAIAQHYGEYPGACGTELLDFTWSLQVAASFACMGGSNTDIGCIYIVNIGEIRELFLGVLEEVSLPDFFRRPTRQQALFLRQYAPAVNQPGIFDRYYFYHSGDFQAYQALTLPSAEYLLESHDDPVLKFARGWQPSTTYLSPKYSRHPSEGQLQYMLELEYHLLGIGIGPKREPWKQLDLIQEAMYHMYQSRLNKALALLLAIDNLGTDYFGEPELQSSLGLILQILKAQCYGLLNDIASAEAILQKKLLDCNAAQKVMILNELGNLYGSSGQYEKALRYHTQAIDNDPNDLTSAFMVGIDLKQLGRYDESLQAFNRIVHRIDPTDAKSWCERANVLNNLRRYDEAIESTSRALSLDPYLVYGWGHQGIAWLFLGEFAKAEDCFRRMIQLRPRDDWARFNLVSALFHQGKREEAHLTFLELQALNPRYPRLEMLAQMLGLDIYS